MLKQHRERHTKTAAAIASRTSAKSAIIVGVSDIQSPGCETAKLVGIICCYYWGSTDISAAEDKSAKSSNKPINCKHIPAT